MITQYAQRPGWRIAPADLGHEELSLLEPEKTTCDESAYTYHQE
jgi:hypothetical protein